MNKTVTVALNQISGQTVNVWWFNTRGGSAQSDGALATAGTHQFSAPTNDDWLLVLDDADRNLPAPGTLPYPPPDLEYNSFLPIIMQYPESDGTTENANLSHEPKCQWIGQ